MGKHSWEAGRRHERRVLLPATHHCTQATSRHAHAATDLPIAAHEVADSKHLGRRRQAHHAHQQLCHARQLVRPAHELAQAPEGGAAGEEAAEKD